MTALTRGEVVGSLRAVDSAATWTDRAGVLIRPLQTFTADQYLTPGQASGFAVRLQPRTAAIAPGHRLRLVLRSQAESASREARPCLPTEPQRETLTGGEYTIDLSATELALPVLPYRHYPTSPREWGTTAP